MKVEDYLSARLLIELLQRDTICIEGLERCAADLLRRCKAGRELRGACIENIARGRLRDHERVSARTRHDIHECERIGILVNLVRR